jgi:hypothetical protein
MLPPDLRLEPFGILLQVLMGVCLPFGKDYMPVVMCENHAEVLKKSLI